MAIELTTPVTVPAESFDKVGVESISFRWNKNNAKEKVSAMIMLKPFNGETGKFNSRPVMVDIQDLFAECEKDAELAALIPALFAKIGQIAKAKGKI